MTKEETEMNGNRNQGIRIFHPLENQSPSNANPPENDPENVESVEDWLRIGVASRLVAFFVFYFLPIVKTENAFNNIIEENIREFNGVEFQLADSSDIIEQLATNVANGIDSRVQLITAKYQKNRHENDSLETLYIQPLNEKIPLFQDSLQSTYSQLLEVSVNGGNSNLPSEPMRVACCQILKDEINRGQRVINRYFQYLGIEFGEPLILPNETQTYRLWRDRLENSGLVIDVSLNSRNVNVKIPFSLPNILIKEFIMLAFNFAHEYLCHLNYDNFSSNSGRQVNMVFKGWLYLMLEKFVFEKLEDCFLNALYDNASVLYDNASVYTGDLIHLKEVIKMHIANYLSELALNSEIEQGRNIAGKFILFLERHPRDIVKERYKNLFYRMTYDLCGLLQTPAPAKHFFTSLGYWLRNDNSSNRLSSILEECLNCNTEQGHIINLGNFWTRIRRDSQITDFPDT